MGARLLAEILITLPYAAPTAFAALGEIIGQEGGVLNIGLEGTMLTACYFALIGVESFPGPWAIAWGFGLAILTAVILNVLQGVFTVILASDQVVVGTAVNLLALGMTSSLYRGRYGHSGQLISLPQMKSWHHIDVMIVLLLILVPAVWYLLQKTAWGLALRAAGDFPKSCEAAGLSVQKLRMGAMVLGGIFAGLGGGYLVLGNVNTFSENMTAGRGFLAIALVTFGRWKPGWTTAAAVLIGLLDSLQFQLQAAGTGIPAQLLVALPYVGALIVLVVVGSGSSAPGSLGLPYRRDR